MKTLNSSYNHARNPASAGRAAAAAPAQGSRTPHHAWLPAFGGTWNPTGWDSGTRAADLGRGERLEHSGFLERGRRIGGAECACHVDCRLPQGSEPGAECAWRGVRLSRELLGSLSSDPRARCACEHRLKLNPATATAPAASAWLADVICSLPTSTSIFHNPISTTQLPSYIFPFLVSDCSTIPQYYNIPNPRFQAS